MPEERNVLRLSVLDWRRMYLALLEFAENDPEATEEDQQERKELLKRLAVWTANTGMEKSVVIRAEETEEGETTSPTEDQLERARRLSREIGPIMVEDHQHEMLQSPMAARTPEEPPRLSVLYRMYQTIYRFESPEDLNEMVHDALAIEHYPEFAAWMREYGEGRSSEECRPIFEAMGDNRERLKSIVGSNYHLFIYAHRDL